MKNYRYHNECIRRNQAQGGGSKPDPLAFFPGVCSGGCLFSSGGPTPTTPTPIFTLSSTSLEVPERRSGFEKLPERRSAALQLNLSTTIQYNTVY